MHRLFFLPQLRGARCRRGSSAGDPRREAGKAAGRIRMLWKIQRRKAGRRQRAQIRPLRLPQAVSERRESPSANMATVRKMKAAEGVSGRRGSTPGAGSLQAGSERPGHCADPSAVADPRCREDGQRQRASQTVTDPRREMEGFRPARPLRGALSCRRSTLPGRWPAGRGCLRPLRILCGRSSAGSWKASGGIRPASHSGSAQLSRLQRAGAVLF